jgi:hypothetical protein
MVTTVNTVQPMFRQLSPPVAIKKNDGGYYDRDKRGHLEPKTQKKTYPQPDQEG